MLPILIDMSKEAEWNAMMLINRWKKVHHNVDPPLACDSDSGIRIPNTLVVTFLQGADGHLKSAGRVAEGQSDDERYIPSPVP